MPSADADAELVKWQLRQPPAAEPEVAICGGVRRVPRLQAVCDTPEPAAFAPDRTYLM